MLQQICQRPPADQVGLERYCCRAGVTFCVSVVFLALGTALLIAYNESKSVLNSRLVSIIDPKSQPTLGIGIASLALGAIFLAGSLNCFRKSLSASSLQLAQPTRSRSGYGAV